MKPLRVVLLSFWRNDQHRQIESRIAHLLSKDYPDLRWAWVVGDTKDETESILRLVAKGKRGKVAVKRFDTCIAGTDPETRLKRLSQVLTAGLQMIRDDDAYCCIHESDLQTPTDLIQRYLAMGKDCAAGWPTLTTNLGTMFYDTWAYRADGVRFSNHPPYHGRYRPTELFQVDSVGCCWLFPAQKARNLVIERLATVELSRKLTAQGLEIWVDPTIPVIQPADLWSVTAPFEE